MWNNPRRKGARLITLLAWLGEILPCHPPLTRVLIEFCLVGRPMMFAIDNSVTVKSVIMSITRNVEPCWGCKDGLLVFTQHFLFRSFWMPDICLLTLCWKQSDLHMLVLATSTLGCTPPCSAAFICTLAVAHLLFHTCCCTLAVAHLLLYTSCCTLPVAHFLLHTCCYTLAVTHLLLHTSCCTLPVAHFPLHRKLSTDLAWPFPLGMCPISM